MPLDGEWPPDGESRRLAALLHHSRRCGRPGGTGRAGGTERRCLAKFGFFENLTEQSSAICFISVKKRARFPP